MSRAARRAASGGIVYDGDADAVAVSDERSFERAELLEVAESVIGAKDNEGIGVRDPVIREGPGNLDEVFEVLRNLKIEEDICGELEAIAGSDDEAVEEGLVGGVGSVAANDVGD